VSVTAGSWVGGRRGGGTATFPVRDPYSGRAVATVSERVLDDIAVGLIVGDLSVDTAMLSNCAEA
jgi:hypothetical protein